MISIEKEENQEFLAYVRDAKSTSVLKDTIKKYDVYDVCSWMSNVNYNLEERTLYWSCGDWGIGQGAKRIHLVAHFFQSNDLSKLFQENEKSIKVVEWFSEISSVCQKAKASYDSETDLIEAAKKI